MYSSTRHAGRYLFLQNTRIDLQNIVKYSTAVGTPTTARLQAVLSKQRAASRSSSASRLSALLLEVALMVAHVCNEVDGRTANNLRYTAKWTDVRM